MTHNFVVGDRVMIVYPEHYGFKGTVTKVPKSNCLYVQIDGGDSKATVYHYTYVRKCYAGPDI